MGVPRWAACLIVGVILWLVGAQVVAERGSLDGVLEVLGVLLVVIGVILLLVDEVFNRAR